MIDLPSTDPLRRIFEGLTSAAVERVATIAVGGMLVTGGVWLITRRGGLAYAAGGGLALAGLLVGYWGVSGGLPWA